jgi:glycosyltransferase involved in cell wall biosynthesis
MNGPPLLLVEALATRNDSGLGRLARLVVDGLAGLSAEAEIHVILPRNGSYRPGGQCRVHAVEARPFRLWTQIAFPLLIRRLRPRAVLCLGQTLPSWRPAGRYALMIPDAGPLEDLGHAASSHDAYNRRWLRSMPPRADAILTIGRFSKERLVALLGLPEGRIHVVRPIGPSRPASSDASVTHARPAGDPAPVAAPSASPASDPVEASDLRIPPPGSYVLAVGNVEPRKNYPTLIEAYAASLARLDPAPPLYIVGNKAWGFREAEEAVRRHGVEGRVRFTGFLPDHVLDAFLRRCAFFVSSSLYEGWGLPLFEALSRGKAALYHKGSSQEEFAAGMALEVDCSDAGALARALERLWSDAGERRRLEDSVARGFGRVLDYDLRGALRKALLPLLAEP